MPLATYEHFADRDQLGEVVLERMLAGVSTRQYRRAQEPVGEEVEADAAVDVEVGGVARRSCSAPASSCGALMNRPLADLRLAVMMLDGIELHGRTNIVALGITTEGDKLALGLWDGSTENATVAAALLSDLVDRGLDVEQGVLFVIDGSKALRKAIRQVFGNDVPVQRCVQAQGAQRARPSPRARPRAGQGQAAPRLGGDRPRPRARAARPGSRSSSTAPTPAPPPRCARGSRRR